eukprot:UN24894
MLIYLVLMVHNTNKIINLVTSKRDSSITRCL